MQFNLNNMTSFLEGAMGRFGIGRRLASGFGVVLILISVFGIYSLSSISTLSDLTEKLYRHPFAVSNAALEADLNIVAIHRTMKDIALASSNDDIQRFSGVVDANEQEVINQFDLIKERFLGDQTQVNEALQTFIDWKVIRDEVIELRIAGDNAGAARITREKGAAHVVLMNTQMRGLIDFARNKAVEFMTNAENTQSSTSFWAITGILACLGIGGFAALIITRSIAGPMSSLESVMGDLSGGKLDVDVPHGDRGDEIGKMAQAVQVFKDNAIQNKQLEADAEKSRQATVDAERAAEVQKREAEEHRRTEDEQTRLKAEEEQKRVLNKLANDFEARVAPIIEAVGAAADVMNETARGMASIAESTSERSAAAASATEQAGAAVQTVAGAAEEMSSSISEINRQVISAANVAKEASESTEEAGTLVGDLQIAAQKVGEIVRLIDEIADQTNLLALNATIEASRAGDAGRGFAVVASEVKSLAGQTAVATNEIAEQVTAIQSATGSVVEAVQKTQAAIGQVNEISNMISSAVTEQSAATQEISRNAVEASKGTTEASENVAEVSLAAQSTGEAAGRVLEAATGLSIQADDLNTQIDGFLKELRVMSGSETKAA